jgi:hemerythrin superfamily protein
MTATAKSKQKSKGHGRAAKGAITTKRSRARVQSSRARVKSSKEPVAQSSIGKTAANVLAGAANAVRALVPQLVADEATATALLEKQHREVERSFATALGTEDARIRRSAMDDILRQLTMHTDIEETIFYPAVRALDTEKAKDMVLEAYEEHHVVKLILKELPKVDPKADTFKAKMTVLKELIAHHVEEEEKEMFPMAERQLGPERSHELAEAMAARAERS